MIDLSKGFEIKHGGRKTRLYNIWCKMIQRCENPNHARYMDYGGRGIGICAEWRHNFAAFRDWAVKNGYQDNLTIDRIDVNGNYCPDNCRWVTEREQHSNTRRNHFVEYGGRKMTVAEAARQYGIEYGCLQKRLARGWPIEKAVETPPKKH